MKNVSFASIRNHYQSLCRRLGVVMVAPTPAQSQAILVIAGCVLILSGLQEEAFARGAKQAGTSYNDSRISNAVNAVMTYLEGSFGALVMAAAGIGAVLSAAFGQYRSALSLMVVSVGAFILRSIMSTFFNDSGIQQD